MAARIVPSGTTLVPRSRFDSPSLFQIGLPQIGKDVGHQLGLVGRRREQDQIGQTFGQPGRQIGQVGVVALELLLDQVVDVAVQAIRHVAVPVGVFGRTIARPFPTDAHVSRTGPINSLAAGISSGREAMSNIRKRSLGRLGGLRLLVDHRLGKLGQRLIGRFFLVEGLLQKLRRIVQTEFLGPGAQRAVAGDLVVLDRLGR